MKLKHWVLLAVLIIGGLYIWHTYSAHGGVAGFKQGLGLPVG